MKNLFLFFLFIFVTCNANSSSFPLPKTKPIDPNADIFLSFDKLPVNEFVSLVYGDILKKNVAYDPSILGRSETVTLHFQVPMSSARVEAYLYSLLESIGLSVEKKPGYVLIKPRVPDLEADNEIFIYRPKFRSVAYLRNMVSGLFDRKKTTSVSASSALASLSGTAYPVDFKPPVSVAAPLPIGGLNVVSAPAGEVDYYVFQGTKKDIERFIKLMSQIDVLAGEVLIKGIVYEVSDSASDKTAFGLLVSLISNSLNLSVGSVSNFGNSVTFKKSVAVGGLDAIYSALSGDSRFKSMSSPVLRAVSGESAHFSAGADVPIQGISSLDKNGNVVSGVEYKSSGVILDISPHVLGDVINLKVRQQISNFIPTTTGVNNSPTLLKREISTTVNAEDGDIVVLGGLTDEKLSNESNGVSILPDWMRSNTKSASKSDLVLVLQVNKI